MKISNTSEILNSVIRLMSEARKIALKHFNLEKQIYHSLKDDKSPVTVADMEINDFLEKELTNLYPDIKIISEEGACKNKALLMEKKLFIIDPIDGTSAFIKGLDEFTINLTLKIDKSLIFSVIYAPVRDVLYYVDNQELYKCLNISANALAEKQIITFSKNYIDTNKLKVIATRREDELQEIKAQFINSAFEIDYMNVSSAIKFCYLAEGKADIYLRMAKIKLWDVLAGFHIASAVGLEILDLQGENIMDYLLTDEYLTKIQENDFRIDKFIIKSPDLFVDY